MALKEEHFEAVSNYLDEWFTPIGNYSREIPNIIKLACPYRHLVVGSMVWRNLQRQSIGYPPVQHNDIDILTFGPPDFTKIPNENISKNSYAKSIIVDGIKIDIIVAPSIDDYFAGVPLSWQACAYDYEQRLFYGPGIKDISEGICRLNNKESLKGGDPCSYALDKAIPISALTDELKPSLKNIYEDFTVAKNKFVWNDTVQNIQWMNLVTGTDVTDNINDITTG